MSEFIEFKDVKKVYRMGEVDIKALDGVDFAIEKSEFVVIAGASGAGKSTILNILGGMDLATSGSVIVDGKDISSFSERELTAYRRFDIGFVFQFYNLVQNLTVIENVEMATQICRDPLNIGETVEAVGLGERKNNFPASFRAASSSGWPSPGPWPKTPSCCCATSRRARLITLPEKQL